MCFLCLRNPTRRQQGLAHDAALERVGNDQSIATCVGIVRVGGNIGAVGIPAYEEFKYETLFWKNIGIKGGVAPARSHILDLLDDVLAGRINPGRVFDLTVDLDQRSRQRSPPKMTLPGACEPIEAPPVPQSQSTTKRGTPRQVFGE